MNVLAASGGFVAEEKNMDRTAGRLGGNSRKQERERAED
jgi:hypothetical protein